MKLIEWINGITKLNKKTMDEFQNNISEAIQEASESGGDGILTGSVIGYNGEEIPEGYEEVENFIKLFEGNAGAGDTIELTEDFTKYKFLHIKTGDDEQVYDGILLGSTLNGNKGIDACKIWSFVSDTVPAQIQFHAVSLVTVDNTHLKVQGAFYQYTARNGQADVLAPTICKVREIWGSM